MNGIDLFSASLENAVEHTKIPFTLSLLKGVRGVDMFIKWAGV